MDDTFTRIPNSILRSGGRLGRDELLVLMAMLSYQKWERKGDTMVPSSEPIWVFHSRLTDHLGYARNRKGDRNREVRRIISKFKKRGVFSDFERGGTGGIGEANRANSYVVNWSFFNEQRMDSTDTEVLGYGHERPGIRTRKSEGEVRTPASGGYGHESPGVRTAASGEYGHECPTRKNHKKDALRKNLEERTLSSASPSDRDSQDASASREGATTCDGCIRPCMTEERIKALISEWNAQIGTLTLTDEKVSAFCKLLAIEERKAETTIQPARVVAAAKSSGIQFNKLFSPEGSSFVWVEYQRENVPSPATPADAALQQIEKALKKKKSKAKPSWSADSIEAIYVAYPRKVGRPVALAAIGKALDVIKGSGQESDPEAFLLARTKLFAESESGQKGKFTPHPATWFNQMRYMDDEAEWNPAGGSRTGNVKRVQTDEWFEDDGPKVNLDDLMK